MSKKLNGAAILADNLRRFMQAKEINSDAGLKGLSQKTINNIKHSRHDPRLSSISKLAHALGVEPYQMLVPISDDKFLAICIAWAKVGAGGRELISAGAEAALRFDESTRNVTDAATTHRQ